MTGKSNHWNESPSTTGVFVWSSSRHITCVMCIPAWLSYISHRYSTYTLHWLPSAVRYSPSAAVGFRVKTILRKVLSCCCWLVWTTEMVFFFSYSGTWLRDSSILYLVCCGSRTLYVYISLVNARRTRAI